MNDMQDCIESMTHALRGSSAWRKATAVRFPDDPRNMRAAATLDRLAADATKLTGSQWQYLKPHFGWASETWRAGLNLAVRQVGFSQRAKDFDSFVTILVRQLSQSSVAA